MSRELELRNLVGILTLRLKEMTGEWPVITRWDLHHDYGLLVEESVEGDMTLTAENLS